MNNKQKIGLCFWLSGLLPSIFYVTIYVINTAFPYFYINRFIAIGIFVISLVLSFFCFNIYEKENNKEKTLMGVNFMYQGNFENRGEIAEKECTIELADNHGTPELFVGPKEQSHMGYIVPFENWDDFELFVQKVNELHSRLSSKIKETEVYGELTDNQRNAFEVFLQNFHSSPDQLLKGPEEGGGKP